MPFILLNRQIFNHQMCTPDANLFQYMIEGGQLISRINKLRTSFSNTPGTNSKGMKEGFIQS